ncbi:HRDC domain-containing protein [Candidatus Magnetomorum sp. HK-1]|nr:HRDC domain-containing protein [Candidatus Magnetomorum sp. HK-1]
MLKQYKFFHIPIKYSNDSESELNQFLKANHIVQIQHELIKEDNTAYWSFIVEYMVNGTENKSFINDNNKTRSRIDYREVLSPKDFAVYAKLREWRKNKAQEESVPVYTIFTNEQLANISEKRIQSKSNLQKIDGIGEARVNKYADTVIKIVAEINKQQKENPSNEKNKRPVQQNI